MEGCEGKIVAMTYLRGRRGGVKRKEKARETK